MNTINIILIVFTNILNYCLIYYIMHKIFKKHKERFYKNEM